MTRAARIEGVDVGFLADKDVVASDEGAFDAPVNVERASGLEGAVPGRRGGDDGGVHVDRGQRGEVSGRRDRLFRGDR